MSQSQKIAILFLCWFVAIIANCGAIFLAEEGIYVVCGIINIAVESYALYKLIDTKKQ